MLFSYSMTMPSLFSRPILCICLKFSLCPLSLFIDYLSKSLHTMNKAAFLDQTQIFKTPVSGFIFIEKGKKFPLKQLVRLRHKKGGRTLSITRGLILFDR